MKFTFDFFQYRVQSECNELLENHFIFSTSFTHNEFNANIKEGTQMMISFQFL